MWIKIALMGVGPFTMVAIRCLLATSALFVYNASKHSRFPHPKVWTYLVIMGLFNLAIPFLLISWSEQYITSGLASILHSTIPLITIVIAHFTLEKDRINMQKLIGLLVGFGGVIVLVSEEIGGNTAKSLLGEMGMLIAALLLAATLVLAQKKSTIIPPEIMSGGQVFIACLFAASFIPVFEPQFRLPSQPIVWGSLLWLGLINSSIGPLLYFTLIRDIGATRTSLMTYMFPLVGVIAGIIFLNERPSWYILVGGILIIIGIAIVNSQLDFITKWLSIKTKSKKELIP